MNCKKEKEYVVGKCICSYPHGYNKEIIKYRIVEKNSESFITDVLFFNENDANMMCDFLNNVLDRKVDEKLERMFRCGEIELPFDFLKEWDNKCADKIIKRFESWTKHHRELVIKCHFDSDLLVFSNCPSDLDPFMICEMLDIPYETHYGAGTFCMEDMILNVAKVKGDG